MLPRKAHGGEFANLIVRPRNRHFRNKKKEYLKAKIDELENNSKIKNIRDLYTSINDFKNVLFTDSHSMMGRWRNHFS